MILIYILIRVELSSVNIAHQTDMTNTNRFNTSCKLSSSGQLSIIPYKEIVH